MKIRDENKKKKDMRSERQGLQFHRREVKGPVQMVLTRDLIVDRSRCNQVERTTAQISRLEVCERFL